MSSTTSGTIFGIKLLLLSGAVSVSILGASLKTYAQDSTSPSWQLLLDQGDQALDDESLGKAEQLYRKALADIKKKPSRASDVVLCQNKLANTLALDGKIDEAQELDWSSLNMLEHAYGTKSPHIVPALFALGSIYESAGDPSTAMALYQRALAISERHYGPYSPAVAKSLHHLALVASKAGNYAQAEGDYKRALSILEQEPGLKVSGEMESLLSDYTDLMKHTDSTPSDLISDFQSEILKAPPKASKSELRPNLVVSGKTLPHLDIGTARKLNQLAFAYFRKGQLEKASTLYQWALSETEKAVGPNNPLVAACLKDYAEVLRRLNHTDQAKVMDERAAKILGKSGR